MVFGVLENWPNTWEGNKKKKRSEEEDIPRNYPILFESLRKVDEKSSVVASDGTSYSRISSLTRPFHSSWYFTLTQQSAWKLPKAWTSWTYLHEANLTVGSPSDTLSCRKNQAKRTGTLKSKRRSDADCWCLADLTISGSAWFHFWPGTQKSLPTLPLKEKPKHCRLSHYYRKLATIGISCSENRESPLNNLPVIPAISVSISSVHLVTRIASLYSLNRPDSKKPVGQDRPTPKKKGTT